MKTTVVALSLVCCLECGAQCCAAPTTTIITHGFTVGEKGAWVQSMAEAIRDRLGSASIYRYEYSVYGSRWRLEHQGGSNHIVLIFNWADESDGLNVGGTWEMAPAAGDALYAMLRDPVYDPPGAGPAELLIGRAIHFIGHSRGAVVNSEAIIRLANASPCPIPVDQMTTLDPHPVDGVGGDIDDWGDPTPRRWFNVSFADNYWREDGFSGKPFDFDGEELVGVYNYPELPLDDPAAAGGYANEHLDVHLWYHGLIDTSQGSVCDGDACIDDGIRAVWYPSVSVPSADGGSTTVPGFPSSGWTARGYHWSHAAGGDSVRPAMEDNSGAPPPVLPTLVGGDFEPGPSGDVSYAGWLYHGGGAAGSGFPIQNGYAELDFGVPAITHNRFFLEPDAEAITARYRVTIASADDQLVAFLTNDEGMQHELTPGVALETTSTGYLGWTIPVTALVETGRAYRLSFEILSTEGAVDSEVRIDDIDIERAPASRVYTGQASGDKFGRSVSGAGDVDGDGYADVIVGAPGFDNSDVGRAYVYSGLTGALLRTLTGQGYFGVSVSGAGDVDGDGYADVIVGALIHIGGSYIGRAYIFSGQTGTLLRTYMGQASEPNFGHSVSGAGDVDGDGFVDVIIGAHETGSPQSPYGRAYVFSGQTGALLRTLIAHSGFDYFGVSVSGAGDVDGDGYADVIIGASNNDAGGSNAGRAYVYSGGTWALLRTFTGEASGDGFGFSVSGAGDVDGDGYADVIIGAGSNDAGGTNAGRVYVYSGLTGALLRTFTGEASGDGFGVSVSGAGDVDGDGYADVIVGASLNAAGGSKAGRAYMYSGQTGALLRTFAGQASGDIFGRSVSGAGDVDGDGYADVIVGAPANDAGGENAGRAYVYIGSVCPAAASLPCAADMSGDGAVDGLDLAFLLGNWGESGGSGPADLNDDGIVDGLDLSGVLGAWGPCP